jgi:hypothetical protein
VNQAAGIDDARRPTVDAAALRREQRLERLIGRLPDRLQTTIRGLRRPSLRWVRVPAGVLLIVGSFASILPFFGLWMLPLGLVLLAEDVPLLRRARDRILDWIERRRPHWFASSGRESESQASPPHSTPSAGRASSASPHQ